MFLANGDFPRPGVAILRENGFLVKSIQRLPGISDEEVIAIALELNLIILTFDRDYGELIFRHSKNNPPSVVSLEKKVVIHFLQESYYSIYCQVQTLQL